MRPVSGSSKPRPGAFCRIFPTRSTARSGTVRLGSGTKDGLVPERFGGSMSPRYRRILAMPTENSTLRHRAHEMTAPALAAYAGEQAGLARGIADQDHVGVRHAAALANFAEWVSSRPRTDERIYALSRLATFRGEDFTYEPGPQQRRLFGMLGTSLTAPLPEATLGELVAAAADDYREQMEAKIGKLKAQAAQVEPETIRADQAEARVSAAEQQAAAAVADLETANDNILDLESQKAHLVEMLGSDAPAEPEGEKKPRRRAVEGHTGVYETWNAKGEMSLELGWREDGKKRWLSVGHTDVEKADRERAEILEQIEAVPA